MRRKRTHIFELQRLPASQSLDALCWNNDLFLHFKGNFVCTWDFHIESAGAGDPGNEEIWFWNDLHSPWQSGFFFPSPMLLMFHRITKYLCSWQFFKTSTYIFFYQLSLIDSMIFFYYFEFKCQQWRQYIKRQ